MSLNYRYGFQAGRQVPFKPGVTTAPFLRPPGLSGAAYQEELDSDGYFADADLNAVGNDSNLNFQYPPRYLEPLASTENKWAAEEAFAKKSVDKIERKLNFKPLILAGGAMAIVLLVFSVKHNRKR